MLFSKSRFRSQLGYLLPLLAIVFLAVGVRFFQLGSVPNGLNRDEASIGYTSFSLLKTGRDEHGVRWPVNVKSFGDWKLPFYIYSLIPLVAIFNLNDWVVRLPSALAGVGTVMVSAVFVTQLIRDKKGAVLGSNSKKRLTLLLPLFIAFSPWAIHMSRIAYEANLAMFFFISGLTAYLFAINQLRTDRRKNFVSKRAAWSLILSALLLSTTLLTYHAYQLVTPLMGVFLLFWSRGELRYFWQKRRNVIFNAAAIVLISITILVLAGSEQANRTKFSGLSIFDKESYSQELFSKRQYFSPSLQPLAPLFINTPTLIIRQLADNVLKVFSPDFLILRGGSHNSHNITGVGNLHRFEIVFIIIGLYFFWKEHRSWQKLVMIWILVALVTTIITFEANHTIRFSPALVPLELVTAYGVVSLWLWMKEHFRSPFRVGVMLLLIMIVVGSYLHYLVTYFVVFPKQDKDFWPWYMPQIVSQAMVRRHNYERIIMSELESSPYIYFLYHSRYDPTKLAKNLEFLPPDEEGFQHVRRLENIYFESTDWGADEKEFNKILYIVRPKAIPGDKYTSANYEHLFKVSAANAEIEYQFLEYNNSSK